MSDKRRGSASVREAVGVFAETEDLKAAVEDLQSAGFQRAELGLLAAEDTVRQRLGDVFASTDDSHEAPDGPRTAFVAKESVGDTVHAVFGGLIFAGVTTAAGALVVSAGALASPLLAGMAGVAAVGGITAAMGALIHQSDAEHLEEQIDEGHLLLFVRTRDLAREKLATAILSRHSAFDVRIYEVPDKRRRITVENYAQARLDPGSVFSTPEDVLAAEDLTTSQKIEVLRRWEYDASEVAVAEEEGMGVDRSDLLHRILRALGTLDAEIDEERRPPTKQGGV